MVLVEKDIDYYIASHTALKGSPVCPSKGEMKSSVNGTKGEVFLQREQVRSVHFFF